MEKIKSFLANTIVMWFKRLGFAGALRWRMLYWAYRLWPGLHIRDKEWDFVLNYLPPLYKWQQAEVLDVGATSSLFIYELARRGYRVYAIDKRPYQERIRTEWICFLQRDVTKTALSSMDFITCISVLEHIPLARQDLAINNMAKALKPGGKLLITIPTPIYADLHNFEGFTYERFKRLCVKDFYLAEYTERKGQICACLVKR